MATDIVVPPLGESIAEAVIARWLKKEGERVEADEPIVDLDSRGRCRRSRWLARRRGR